jgi:capsid assembly protease
MKNNYSRVLGAIAEQPWAIHQPMLETICEVVSARASGVKLSKDEIQARLGVSAARPVKQVVGTVAVIPVVGVLAQKMNMFTEISGGTSYQQLTAQYREFRDDPQVKAIVFEHDSPGGSVLGLQELAEEILESRDAKRTIAVVNSECYSASLYLAAACHEIVVTPSGLIGSIGTIVVHGDYSKMNEMVGFKPTYITSSKYKAEANPDTPLGDEALAHLKAMVDTYGEQFEKFVAKGRNVSVSRVREEFGQGRILMAKDAVRVGLADRVATMDDVIAKLVGKKSTGARADAEDVPTVTASDPEPAIDDQALADSADAAVRIAERF